MAESPPLNRAEGDHKSVEELVNDGVEIPDRYISKEDSPGGTGAPFPPIEIPIIDLSLLTSTSATTQEELQKLQSVLSSWGCFQVINHGIQFSILDELPELARQFFHLPVEEKQKYARPEHDLEGYGTDMALNENHTLDWTDRLYLLVNPEDRRKLEFWPESPKSLRKTLHEYSAKVTMIIEIILKSLAKTMDLSENSFLIECGEEQVMYCRFNFYPPCSRPESVLGLRPHTDGSAMTVVLPDKEVEGLQLQKDNQWFRVQTVPRALLVNAGDQLEIMSNGIVKSPMHRAVTNSAKERISIAMFWAPDFGRDIGPLEGLINDERPRLFKNVKDYHETFYKHYQLSKRAIDTVRI